MNVCPWCRHRFQAGAKFCAECGAALAPAAPAAREERKVVTVLFADLVGFTSRAEQLDPEDVRAVLAPYYARLRAELERLGGTVEKFIGDAVMALFGAPVVHEDDPERAVRAALAIRDWARDEGRVEVRVGVATGEALIVMGARPAQGEAMAAGDVVNTAARLQAAAPVNGVLVGERTYRATQGVIGYRPVQPVAAKGKKDPVPVWEALDARARLGVEVPFEARTVLVGRDRELRVLADALERVRAEWSPQLVTLVGVPGIGKSRLVYEMRQSVAAKTELVTWRRGRSLPYGEGMGFGALAEIVKAQAGILETDSTAGARAKLAQTAAEVMPGAAEAGWVVRHLGALVGLRDGGGGQGSVRAGAERSEVFAAWRQFMEAQAGSRPLVLVFEDLHWAGDGLLDFVDYLAEWVSGVPLLIIGTARPELLARRPGWGGGKPNVVTLSLPPLSDQDTMRLLGLLAGQTVTEPGQEAALLDRVGGNPLFAEQYAAMLTERAPGHPLPVPESVQAIIGARLDLLTPDDKRVLHDAAVIGRVFWPGAVAALGGPPGRNGALEERLHTLEARQFLRREQASLLAGERQYAFAHVLVRDVAYGQIPRAARAEKHACAAAWIESLGRAEDHAEMLAHHYLAALELARAASQDTTGLAPRARAALRTAGDRAFLLNSLPAAAGYYRAALDLWPEDASEQRTGLLRMLGTALFEAGDLTGAEAALAKGAAVAADPCLPAAQARIRIKLAEIHNQQGRGDALGECEAATAILDSQEDLEGLAEAWCLAGQLRFERGESPADRQALERAMAYARRSGSHRAQLHAGGWLLVTLMQLPVPASAAIAYAEQIRQAATGDPWAEADTRMTSSVLYAYTGRFTYARDACAAARSAFAGFGAKLPWAVGAIPAGHIELIAADPAAAERHLREGYETLRAMGERGYLCGITAQLAEALYLQDRLEEAQRMTEEAQALAPPGDLDGQARWRTTRAKLLARRGQFAAARQMAGEAVALISPTSWAIFHADTLMAQAEVNRLAGAPGHAADSLRAALRIYEDRSAVPLAERARAALNSLTTQPATKPS